MNTLQLTSPVFADGDSIPDKYGYTAENVNPPLEIEGVPDEADSLALVVDDPDAVEGKNDYGEHGYGGPNPPDRKHTYRFKLYALDGTRDFDTGATKEHLEAAMEENILAETKLEGTFAP